MNTKEFPVARLAELKAGEMKQVNAGGTDVLLARVGDECFAVGAHCTHYGAPLADGFLSGDRIVCPWHHACFSVKTGELEEPPAFDALPRFEVRVDGEQIFVQLPEKIVDRRVPKMAKRAAGDDRKFVVLGGGAAGFIAVQTMREEGFEGRVILITREDRPPYDRPNLSKDYLQGNAEPEWMPLRPDEFYAENDIEICGDTEAVRIDTAAKEIHFRDGSALSYDKLLLATGGIPRKLPFQSDRQKNVFLLRSFVDSDAIIASAREGSRAVVIGASFIGMEAASSLRTRGCEVTVIAPDETPFQKILGTEVGKLFQNIHESNGVKFRLGKHVKGFGTAADGSVAGVLLGSGEQVDADLVVVGVGVAPATDILEGVELHKDGGVIADEYLRIADDVYAAGDIVHFPDARTMELSRIEHWRVAMQQGRTAARNMSGGHETFRAVPFFWTRQFDETLTYVGHAREWDRIMFDGEVESKEFLAFYLKDNRILAVAGMNRDRDMAIWEESIRNGRVLSPDQLSVGSAEIRKNSIDSLSSSARGFL